MKRPAAWIFGLLAISLATPALAQDRNQDRYPARPIRLVIPSVPAGVHDVIGRIWAERVKPQLGTIVVDNRGGGGLIGANDVAHSPPDGYSILLGSTSTHVLLSPVMANPPYDPVKDFAAVAVFAYSSTSVVINPSVPVPSRSSSITPKPIRASCRMDRPATARSPISRASCSSCPPAASTSCTC
jgi:tripartite-type tricarboxylate transporter receptor subunit TctC